MLALLGYVHTWFKSTVPDYDYHWVLMWTHPFIKYPRQNLGTVTVPKYKVETLYLGSEVGTGSLSACGIFFVPATQAPVLRHQGWT